MTQHSDEIPATGAVFTFGRSRFADNEPSHFFIKNDPVVSISCGDEHSAVICQQGRVFVFGGNSYGQLGLGHTDDVTRPSCVKWLKPQKAIFVACGLGHTIFVTDTYAIYTVGNNTDGQLGTGNTESQCVPQYVDLETDDTRIQQVSAGSSHTVILTANGRVFVCGSNTEGQLGLGDDVKMVSTLTELKFMETISFVECGNYHTVFITNKGVVFVTGENEGQKLGIEGSASNIFVPKVLPIGTAVKSACCGASHTFLLSEDEAKVFALGSNEQGQLGLPKAVVDVTVPTDLPIDKMFEGNQLKLVSCGAFHTAFVTDNGFLYTCGEARHNKLCLDRLENDQGVDDAMPNQYTPKRVTAMAGFSVDNVACGGCHTIMTAIKSQPNGMDKENSAVPFQLPPLSTVSFKNGTVKMNDQAIKVKDEVGDNVNDGLNKLGNVADNFEDGMKNVAKDVGESVASGMSSIKSGLTDATDKIKDTGEMIKEKVEDGSNNIKAGLMNATDKIKDTGEKIKEKVEYGSSSIKAGLMDATDKIRDTGEKMKENVEGIGDAVKDKFEHIGDKTKAKLDETLDGAEALTNKLQEDTSSAFQNVAGQMKTALSVTDKLSDAKGVLGIPDPLTDVNNSPPPKSPKLLQPPAQSPALSHKSESTTENETIICESDKSSPVDGKTKMQAVLPILRSEDVMSDVEEDRLRARDDNEVVVRDEKESKGPFSRMMQSIRDKENSCMGKSKVIENTVVENIHKGISGAEETVHKVEETITHEIRDQTSSRTCSIL